MPDRLPANYLKRARLSVIEREYVKFAAFRLSLRKRHEAELFILRCIFAKRLFVFLFTGGIILVGVSPGRFCSGERCKPVLPFVSINLRPGLAGGT
jgi:hypothetical protein